MLEDVPISVDRKPQLVVFDGTPDRISIKAQEYRGRSANIYIQVDRF